MMQSMSMLVKSQDRKVAKTLKTNKDKDLKILEQKTKSKDNDKGSRSNITKYEGTSLQQDKDQNEDSRTKRQSNLNKSKECMQTRSSSKFIGEPSMIPKRHNLTMADQRTMVQLLQAPTEGYEDAIVVPMITADNFELKHGLLTLVQNKQFFGHDKEDPHAHI
ncbi:hypothetical protein Tco_0542029 [Tanacetum coccineum]